MRTWLAFVICLIGLLLPWRLRVLYANMLGWVTQAVYWTYQFLLKIIIQSLKKEVGGS